MFIFWPPRSAAQHWRPREDELRVPVGNGHNGDTKFIFRGSASTFSNERRAAEDEHHVPCPSPGAACSRRLVHDALTHKRQVAGFSTTGLEKSTICKPLLLNPPRKLAA